MKLTKKTKAEVLEVYDIWLHSYLNGDVKTYDKYLDDDYHFIGSTNNEEFLNRKDTTSFFEATADQLAGKCKLKNENRTLEKFGELVFITHLFDAWFLNGTDWAYYGRFRFTSALQEKKEGWRFIYQHFSTTDSKAEEGETIGFDLVSAENLQLKEAIKRRTFELEAKNRELEVEGALERIRARAVAMKQSSDILDIVVTMRDEFIKLGHEAHYFWHMMWLPDTYEKAMTSGDGTKIGFVMELPRHIHGDIPLLAKWEKSKKPTAVYAMDVEAALDYVDKMISLGDFQNIDPQAPSHDDIRHLGGLTFIMARTTHGEIGYSLPGVVRNPPAEDLEVLIQFARAFDLAHQRFLDLQKSEKQAREVQIELALEKVRSRTMAMQKSEELADVATVLFQQVKELGIPLWTCGFNIWDIGDTEFTFYPGGPDGEILPSSLVPLMEHPIFKQFDESRRRGDELLIYEKEGEVQKDHYRYMHSLPGIGDMLQGMLDSGLEFPDYQIDHVANFAYGNLIFITYEPFPKMHSVFKRFAKVFEQTYTRFLDLQKAEAQAREAQIEASLERVRSQAMAMRHSDDLMNCTRIVFDELEKLDLSMERSGIGIFDPETKDCQLYTTVITQGGKKELALGITSLTIHPMLIATFDAWEKQKSYSHVLEGKELEDYYKIISKNDFILSDEVIGKSAALPKEYYHYAPFGAGGLYFFADTEPNDADKHIIRRFAEVFDLTYTRYEDLQKAEAQAREAQIEAALEKVRSRSLAMHQSEELLDVITEISLQLEVLKITLDSCFINIYKDENSKDITMYIAAGGRTYKNAVFVPFIKNPMFTGLLEARKKNESFYSIKMGKKDTVRWWKQFFANAKNIKVPIKRRNFIAKSPGIATSVSLGKYASFHVLRYMPTPYMEEENQIFMRFGKVFDQAYTRFLDLQKAEAQAREAQIEAALERVRSRSMAMHRSDELLDVITVVSEQLQELNFKFNHVSFANNDLDQDYKFWSASKGMSKPMRLNVPYSDIPIFNHLRRAQKKSLSFHTDILTKQEHRQWHKHLLKYCEPNLFSKADNEYIMSKGMARSIAINANIMLILANYASIPYSEVDNKIIQRFGQVFEQSYTRFLDLQKAEAQAREAQIEAALERVRSKAMAMRSSEDIGEATTILFKEIEKLEIKTMRCGILIIHQNKVMDVWTTSTTNDDKIIRVSGQIDMTIHPLLKSVYRSWKANKVYTRYELKGQDGENYYNALTREVNYNFPNSSVIKGKHFNTWFNFKEGALFAFTKNEIPDEAIKIFQRFSKVFGLTYQRYRELIESEKREKEAKKQASLDRVRGEIASMRSTEDLDRITPIIWQELTNLGVPFFRCGVFIMNEEKGNTQVYLSDPSGKSLGLMNLDYTTNDLVRKSVDAWRINSVFKAHWSKEEFINWTTLLIKLGKIKTKKGYQGGDIAPESLHLHFVPFSQGMLYVGNLQPLTDDQIELVKNLSESFSIAYARYEDFVKLEKAKESVETTLTELKTTQSQLIQSEKMASLGELTAGIAHEIQNPLNFVNNFSEVSKELLEEMLEEMENGDMVEVKAIMDDIVQNLDKINHHGKRADGIVKGMLQHSRVSGDKKEPTDINKLADEYLRLAYHGLRAKDKSFNAQLVTDFDKSIKTINVIPQDMGRVILNLLTNAFYVVNEKKIACQAEPVEATSRYEPTVSISTKKNKDSIEIKVTDNGNGMPDHVKEKIFQPFFTTKPTGQGTGLGLSMSYDIITKGHGGELKVETKVGEGTEFIILLPV